MAEPESVIIIGTVRLPVPVQDLAHLSDAFTRLAKSQYKETAYMRQTGECLEFFIYDRSKPENTAAGG